MSDTNDPGDDDLELSKYEKNLKLYESMTGRYEQLKKDGKIKPAPFKMTEEFDPVTNPKNVLCLGCFKIVSGKLSDHLTRSCYSKNLTKDEKEAKAVAAAITTNPTSPVIRDLRSPSVHTARSPSPILEDVDVIDEQKIRYRSKSIERVIENMVNNNPEKLYLVWFKNFSLDLASAVARSGYNCILIVKKFLPASLVDTCNLWKTFHISEVEIGQNSDSYRLFSFGGMDFPKKVTRNGKFKSLTKLESKMKTFARSQGMELVNVFKQGDDNNGWYELLRTNLNEECVITNAPKT